MRRGGNREKGKTRKYGNYADLIKKTACERTRSYLTESIKIYIDQDDIEKSQRKITLDNSKRLRE